MSPGEPGLSIQDALAASLGPLGGPLRIDSFIRLMTRERSRKAAEERALREAELKSQVERESSRKPKARPQRRAGPEITDEVQAFLKRDQIDEATTDEVSEFLEYIGDAGFDPESLPD